MPQLFASVLATPEPLRAIGGANSTTVQVLAQVTVNWQSGSPDVVPTGSTVATLESSATTVDASANVWIVVAWQGTNLLHLVKESDYSTLDSLTSSGQWAPLYRLQVGRLDVFQQS